MPIRVLIADEHKLFCEGLTNLLNGQTMEVVGFAENDLEVFEKLRDLKPDIILIEVGMKFLNGIKVTKILTSKFPLIKIIGLSMQADHKDVTDMLEAGAHGFLLKNCTYIQLVEAIQNVLKGSKVLSPEITEMVINEYLNLKNDSGNNCDLSEREVEVLIFLAEGYTTHEIADKLCISSKTVATHKQHIKTKINARSMAEIIRFALKNGFATLS